MKINTIFYSIQGEGPLIGVPMIFIRTSGCNLKCTKETVGFDCDTSYHIEGKDMTQDEIIKEVQSYDCNNICITGGEPSIQKKRINSLIYKLHSLNYKVQIETNGSLKHLSTFLDCIIVCSPKYNIQMKKWMFHKDNEFIEQTFKFVYTNNGKEILEFVVKYNIEEKDIYIMPEGIDRKTLIKNSIKTVEFCKKYGFKFSPREHIMIWNIQRGV